MSNYYGNTNAAYYGSSSGANSSQFPQSSWQQPPNQQKPSSQGSSQSSTGDFYQGQQQWTQPQQPSVPSVYGSQSQHQPAHSQQEQQLQQPHQSQQTQAPSFWNPATAATMAAVAGTLTSGGKGGGYNSDAMFDLASSAGKTFLQSGTARMIPGLESTMLLLRTYFAVDNQYVVKKMKKIQFPFLSKSWKRSAKDAATNDHGAGAPSLSISYQLPITDENAPDLYLPVMSLITYVLLCALCYGTAGKFNPEVIPDVTTKCFATQILEVLIIRFGFYTMQAPVPMLDLFSYTGYKYLGLCVNILVALLVGHFGLGVTGYYVTFCWTASAASFFMLKTMANNIPAVTAATGPKREVMVLAFAASQFATMWFVSQTKFL